MRRDARYSYLDAVHLYLKFGPLLVFSMVLTIYNEFSFVNLKFFILIHAYRNI